MMIASVSQYILSAENAMLFCRTLRDIDLVRDGENNPICYVGNSAIVFKVKLGDELHALRVYMRPHPNLRAIYRDKFYPQELFVCHEGNNELWADVVLCDWHEGFSLQHAIINSLNDNQQLQRLSHRFEIFAAELLDKDWAHGDLKPENIIVGEDALHLIDFDAIYHKTFSREDCVELGTRPYQHPTRSKENFGNHIDDYPIALITTALAALAYDASLGDILHNSDYLLVNPAKAIEGCDTILERIEALFASKGDARHLAIARLLRSRSMALPLLRSYLTPTTTRSYPSEELSLECKGGLWGYMRGEEWVIPPYYDLGFEFSEGVALVRIGEFWNFINERGDIVISCGKGRSIKPMRNGKTHIIYDDSEAIIYLDGRIEKY